MTEAGKDHISIPPSPEPKEEQISFTQPLLTKVDLYHSKPKGFWDRKKCLLEEKVGPGIKIMVEGANSWQQWCERHPKAGPGDIWVEGEIVFDPDGHRFEKRKVFVTRGDMKRLPPENRKESQKPLTRRTAKGPSLSTEKKSLQSSQPNIEASQIQQPENTIGTEASQLVEKQPITSITLYPGVRLFKYQPRARLENQSDELREGTLNALNPLVVTEKIKMVVPGKNPLDAYNHVEGTFFRGKVRPVIGENKDQEYSATIGDVRRFAEIGRSREK